MEEVIIGKNGQFLNSANAHRVGGWQISVSKTT